MRSAVIAILILVAAGCDQGISSKDIVFVDPPDAQKLLEERSGLLGLGGEKKGVFVDPRSVDEWARGHIGGAVHLPLQYAAVNSSMLEGYGAIIVYGDTYNDPMAEAMSKRLMESGVKDVRNLRGGLAAWTSAGHELQTGFEGAFVE